MKLRIIETLKEMCYESRINGVIMLWVIPSLVAFSTDMHLKCTCYISLGLFLFCFLCVRFTLD